jgi:hypothetical protein
MSSPVFACISTRIASLFAVHYLMVGRSGHNGGGSCRLAGLWYWIYSVRTTSRSAGHREVGAIKASPCLAITTYMAICRPKLQRRKGSYEYRKFPRAQLSVSALAAGFIFDQRPQDWIGQYFPASVPKPGIYRSCGVRRRSIPEEPRFAGQKLLSGPPDGQIADGSLPDLEQTVAWTILSGIGPKLVSPPCL